MALHNDDEVALALHAATLNRLTRKIRRFAFMIQVALCSSFQSSRRSPSVEVRYTVQQSHANLSYISAVKCNPAEYQNDIAHGLTAIGERPAQVNQTRTVHCNGEISFSALFTLPVFPFDAILRNQ